MKTNEQIKRQLEEGYNITSDVSSIIGDWIVTTDGDLINLKYSYPIYSYQIDDDTWLIHLEDKTWFDEVCKNDFIKAFKKACEILKIEVEFKDSY